MKLSGHLIALLAALLYGAAAFASDKVPTIKLENHLIASTCDSAAFWTYSNTGGLIPKSGNSYLGLLSIAPPQPLSLGGAFTMDYGASLAVPYTGGHEKAFAGANAERPVPGELFVGLRWNKVSADFGIRKRQLEHEEISVSGGDISWSGNARNLPGVAFTLNEYTLPFARKLSIRGQWGDYVMPGPRYITNPLLHHEEGYLTWSITPRLSFTAGLEDWGIWAGTTEDGTRLPVTFGRYLSVVTGGAGSAGDSEMDKENALGNHLGRTLMRLNWRGDGYSLSLSKDSPFEDRSGMVQKNFPDGIWTLAYSTEKDSWISDAVLELIYTKNQSGEVHAREATEEEKALQDPESINYGWVVTGGCDAYFNHMEYRSGWTHYGRTVGIPLFIPQGLDANGICPGVACNSLSGLNIGLRGKLFHTLPYSFRTTAVRHYGCKFQRDPVFQIPMTQYSSSLVVTIPKTLFADSIRFGLYTDFGSLYPARLSASLTLTYRLL
ncbi:MAG: hypothetical protein IJS07_01335 [Bacteroidales bacterium]|nr:hypothetical protein [Bacteroidales bacterium]